MSVVTNIAKILRLISENEPCSLNFLTQQTKMKKPTLFVNLKALTEVNYVEKNTDNLYSLGENLVVLSAKRNSRKTQLEIIKDCAQHLRNITKETVVIAEIEKLVYKKVLIINSSQIISINESAVPQHCFYSSATGRAMLAIAQEELLEKILKSIGLPDENEWKEAKSGRQLKKELEKIKLSGYAEMKNITGEAVFIAVPMLLNEHIFAIGLSIPEFRYDKEAKEKMIGAMKLVASEIMGLLTIPS